MAYQGIVTGTSPNDNNGDTLLDGAIKINSNFQEIYSALGDGNTINTEFLSDFNVDVTQTSYNGTSPITTLNSVGISTISIAFSSNAYGTRWIETYTPTIEGNNGDIWYQVSS